ncbi:MAG: protein tyrosine phosphatase family protein [Gemmatimonadota bacterium]|nr:protein tyrosine phosphatase family protein [Gemmatimonadota bacterium]MDH3424352.1 protein tyrosine phosphatase family protein [Gemmatimonadota bacterium]
MEKLSTVGAALALSALGVVSVHAQERPAPLTSVRNFQEVSEQLASSGQIGYDQIPLLTEAGYEVVINLAIADEERNGREGFLVAQEGLTYVHIPVDWAAPTLEDVEMFFDVMGANEGRKVYVHCFANMRASAFVYMYRTLVEGVPEDEALATMNEVWDPWELEQWGGLIERARAEHGARR